MTQQKLSYSWMEQLNDFELIQKARERQDQLNSDCCGDDDVAELEVAIEILTTRGYTVREVKFLNIQKEEENDR